jgi:hypothetical protein
MRYRKSEMGQTCKIPVFVNVLRAVYQPTGFFVPAFSAYLNRYWFVCDFVFANKLKTFSSGLWSAESLIIFHAVSFNGTYTAR